MAEFLTLLYSIYQTVVRVHAFVATLQSLPTFVASDSKGDSVLCAEFFEFGHLQNVDQPSI